MPVDADVAQVAGPMLLSARRSQRLTLSEAASAVGLSSAYLSRLEKGQRQPSLGVLVQLARLYGVSVGELLGEQVSPGHLVTRRSVRARRSGPDGPFEVLTGLPEQNRLQGLVLRVESGADHALHVHDDEELIFVVSGAVDVRLGDAVINLSEGDSLHFDARIAHDLTECAPGTLVLIICSPLRTPGVNVHARDQGASTSH